MSQAMYDPQMQAIDRRRQLSQMLMQQATAGNRNFSTPGSVYGSIAQSLAGAFGTYMSDRQAGQLDTSRREEMQQFMQQAMGGQGGGAPPPQAPPSSVRREDLGRPSPGVGGTPDEIRAMIQEASRETGVPAHILEAQIRQESNFDPNAVGRAGEVGLAQIMPATARQPGFGMQGVDPETLRDPRNNVRFGAQYLAARGRHAGVQDWNDPAQQDRALAAYNGGGDPNYVQNVRRHLSQGGQDAAPAGVQQPPAPQMPRNAWGPALAASQSQNPYIQRMAPVLGQMAGREQTARPTVQMVGPEGPGIYERQADGSTRYLGGLPESAPRSQERFQQDRELAQAGRTQVNVPVNTERGFYGELAQRGGRRIDELQQQATQGAEAIRTAQRVQGLLQSGAITGTGAGMRETIERAFASAGLVDGQRVANTGQLMAELAGATLAAAGGLSGPTSDRDILFLREAAGGRLELTAETISRIAQLSADRGGRVIDQYNSVAEGLANDQQVPEPMRRLYRPIERPIADARPEQQQPGMRPGPQGPQPPAQSGGRRPPEPGAVEDGYRYLGGNPANPRSWERVQ